MGFWDNLKEAFSKSLEHGGKVEDWFHGINFVQFIEGAAILAGIGLGVWACISQIPEIIENKKHELEIKNCVHENYDMDYVKYNHENKTVNVVCDFCRKEFTFEANVEYPEYGNYEPTCTAFGSYTERWTLPQIPDLEYFYSYSIPKIPHELGQIIDERVEPTCTSSGSTESGYCSFCYNFIDSEVIDMLEHDYVLSGYVAPSCSYVGYSGVNKCTRCGDSDGINEVIPMIDHTPVYGTYEETYSTGKFTGEKCDICNIAISIENLHSQPQVNNYFTYEIINNEYVIITGVVNSLEEMIIPDNINGYPVIGLSDGLFMDNTVIKEIYLSRNLVEISANAFNGCSNLHSITIPDSVMYIGSSAFYNCSNLRFVDLGHGVQIIDTNAFKGCISILSFRFSPNIDYNCINDNDIFEEGMIGTSNDLRHFSISVLYAPASFKYLLRCEYFYTLEETDEHVIEEDGYYWYNDGGDKVLLGCDSSKVKDGLLVVPDGTNIISENFLYHNIHVTKLIIPESVYWIKRSFVHKSVFESIEYINIYYQGNINEYGFMIIDVFYLTSIYSDSYAYRQTYYEGEWKLDSNGDVVLNW